MNQLLNIIRVSTAYWNQGKWDIVLQKTNVWLVDGLGFSEQKYCFVMEEATMIVVQSVCNAGDYVAKKSHLLHSYLTIDRYMVKSRYICGIYQSNLFVHNPDLLHALPYYQGPDCGYRGNCGLYPLYTSGRGWERSIYPIFVAFSNVALFGQYGITFARLYVRGLLAIT